MANTILTPDVVAREALLILKNNTVTASLVYRDYEQEWKGAKKGDTVKIRRPAAFQAQEFITTINVQDIDEGSVEQTVLTSGAYDLSLSLWARIYDNSGEASTVRGELIVDGDVVGVTRIANAVRDWVGYEKLVATWQGTVATSITVRVTLRGQGEQGWPYPQEPQTAGPWGITVVDEVAH